MIQETSPHGYPAEPWRMGVTVPQQDAKSRTCTRLRTIRVLFAVSGLASGAIRLGRGGYDRGEYLTKVATVQTAARLVDKNLHRHARSEERRVGKEWR